MKKTFTLILLSAILCGQLPAQIQEQEDYIQPNLTARLSLIFPQFSLEAKTSEKTTVVLGFWTGISNYYDHRSQDYRVIFTPKVTMEPRYYFNLDTRVLKGKRIDNFSGAYVGVPFHVEFPEVKFNLGPVIGFQKTLGYRGFIHLSIGPAVAYYDETFHSDIVSSFGLGFILN